MKTKQISIIASVASIVLLTITIILMGCLGVFGTKTLVNEPANAQTSTKTGPGLSEAAGAFDTSKTEFFINTEADLNTFRDIVNKTNTSGNNSASVQNSFSGKIVYLTRNLEIATAMNLGIGKNSTYYFAGTFDGQNFRIIIDSISDYNFQSSGMLYGFFGYVKDGSVKNLKFKTNSFSVYRVDYIACLIGGLYSSKLENCMVEVIKMYITYAYNGSGGMVGIASNSEIKNCSIKLYTIGVNQSLSTFGGIVGNLSSGNVTNCYSDMTVDVDFNNLGGIAGIQGSGTIISSCVANVNFNFTYVLKVGGISGQGAIIKNCVATGTFICNYSSTSAVGVYVGGITAKGTITDCLSDVVIFNKNSTYHLMTGISPQGTVERCGVLGDIVSVNGCYLITDHSSSYKNSNCFADLSYTDTSADGTGKINSANSTNLIYNVEGKESLNPENLKSYDWYQNAGYFENGWIYTDEYNYKGYPVPKAYRILSNKIADPNTLEMQETKNAWFDETVTLTKNAALGNVGTLNAGFVSVQLNGGKIYTLNGASGSVDTGYSTIDYTYSGGTLTVNIHDIDYTVEIFHTFTFYYLPIKITDGDANVQLDAAAFNYSITKNTFELRTVADYTGGYFPKFRTANGEYSYFRNNGGDLLNYGEYYYSYSFTSGELNILIKGAYNKTAPVMFELASFAYSLNNMVTVSVPGGNQANVITETERGTTIVHITPVGNFHINSFTVNNSNAINVEYYLANILNVGNSFLIQYAAKDDNNTLTLRFENIYGNIAIACTYANGSANLGLKEYPSGSAVSGVVVTAQTGGEARIVGNNLSDESPEDATVILIAVPYTGYSFSGWINESGDVISNDLSMAVTKQNALNKIFTATFQRITNGNINTDLSYVELLN